MSSWQYTQKKESLVFSRIRASAVVTNVILSVEEFLFIAVWMAAQLKQADPSVLSVLSKTRQRAVARCVLLGSVKIKVYNLSSSI